MEPRPQGGTPSGPVRGNVIADRYEVGELIGRGGMAEVFAGTDHRLGRPVAIKLLQPEMAARADIRSRFEAEARAAASLSHPNAVAVFDTGEHDGVPYIVMERLPGKTLADHIAEGPVDPQWARTVAIEVLGALGAAHATGLVHRDVKPGNVLLAADGRAEVADFGIAKSVESAEGVDLTATGQLLGTPAYLSPERLDGSPATASADIYAVGVVLYEALTGAKPFSGPTPLAMARAVALGDHRALSAVRPDLDPTFAAVVERAMDPDPARRFTSADEMASALTSVSASVGAGAGAGEAATVADAPAPGTLVLDGDEMAAAGAPTVPPAAPRQLSLPSRRMVMWGLLAAVAVLAVVAVARAVGSGGDKGSSVATAASTTTAPRTSTSSGGSTATGGIGQQLRDQAGRLSADDGPLATVLAGQLRQLADRVDAGQPAGPQATALLAVVSSWTRAGQVSSDAGSAVISLLAQVPGSAASGTTTPAVTSAPASGGKGKKGKGGGD